MVNSRPRAGRPRPTRRGSELSASTHRQALVPLEDITREILILRGHRVLLDSELAALYGVETRVLNQAVRRNAERFPEDFRFQLTPAQAAASRSQSVISNSRRGGRRYAPYAFTEHGAIMAATVLNSPRAVEMSIYVVRAFVQLRELLSSNKELAKRLDQLLPYGIVVVRSRSNRIIDLTPHIPAILPPASQVGPGRAVTVGA